MYQFNIEFEYDEEKSEANRLKHGLALSDAKALWAQFGSEWPAVYFDEERWLRVGWIGERLFTWFYLSQQKVRLISLRRSRDIEVPLSKERQNEKKKPKPITAEGLIVNLMRGRCI
jgi:hypothetical protein